ncbi:MAG: hypothetical protein RL414_1246 [Actinomycetota bacterium]
MFEDLSNICSTMSVEGCNVSIRTDVRIPSNIVGVNEGNENGTYKAR